MKKRQGLIIAFTSLLVSTLALSVVTFAWIDYHKEITNVELVSGSLKVNNLTTTVYKYIYPYYSDTTIVNYDGASTITPFTPSVASPSVEMNIFDPTYITIVLTELNHPGVSHSQSDVSALYTNLVFKFSFTLSYATAVTLSFSSVRKSSFTHAPSAGSYGVSHYTNFFGISATDFATALGEETPSASTIFSTIKSLSENATNLATRPTFASDDATTLDFYSGTLVASRPSSEVTDQAFDFYVNVDYQDALCSLFYDSTHLGNRYALSTDYTFALKLSEALT